MQLRTLQLVVCIVGVVALTLCGSQSQAAGAGSGRPRPGPSPSPPRPAPRPQNPNDPRRFLAVTKWYGTYTITLRARADRQERRDEPQEGGAPIHEAFTGDVVFSYTTFFRLEFDEKEVDTSKPPAWSEWKGFASADHRSTSETHTRYTCRGKDVNEEKTTWKKTTTEGRADIPTGPNKPKVDDDDSTHQCSEGRVTINIKKGTYDFLIGPPNKSATVTVEGREEERANGEVLRSTVTPPTTGGVMPMGSSIKKNVPLFPLPLMLGPVQPKPGNVPTTVQDAMRMLTSSAMGNIGYKLPTAGMVLSGSESIDYQVEIPNAPWQDTKEYEPVTLEASWTFTPYKSKLLLAPADVGAHQKWLPVPIDQPRSYGVAKQLTMKATLQPAPGSPAQEEKIHFRLANVTKYKGICLNDPPFSATLPPEREDLRFAPQDQQPQNIRRLSDTECE
ncbi:MAG: hypothetical protein HY318_05020, partial [Armatimonadetes bacterium]|nr:hypothetical protein [Armatimonadota bacterium]